MPLKRLQPSWVRGMAHGALSGYCRAVSIGGVRLTSAGEDLAILSCLFGAWMFQAQPPAFFEFVRFQRRQNRMFHHPASHRHQFEVRPYAEV